MLIHTYICSGENAIADSICNISPYLLCAAIFTFAISMLPTYRGVFQSIDIVFNSKRVAYTESGDSDDTIFVTNLLAPVSKRWLIFVSVNLFELFLALILTWCGIGYILSSDDVDDVLMNSLSVVFIMSIDDMACEAFQPQVINGTVYMLIRTYNRTYIYSCVHMLIHTYTHTYIYSYMHMLIHTYTHTYTHTYIHTLLILISIYRSYSVFGIRNIRGPG